MQLSKARYESLYIDKNRQQIDSLPYQSEEPILKTKGKGEAHFKNITRLFFMKIKKFYPIFKS